MAFHVGDRSRDSAKQLWANLPEVYRTQAMFYTDQYEAYKGVIPAEWHQAITKQARKTNTDILPAVQHAHDQDAIGLLLVKHDVAAMSHMAKASCCSR